MAELETQNGQDDPSAKARMRDLQEEQEQIHQDLRTLLDDIQDHAEKLPNDPKLEDLRKTAQKFADAVDESKAYSQMQETQEALSDFAGSRASAAAHAAAKTLDDFISKCNGMGDKAGECLRFQPKLASALGNTIDQLLGASGLPSMGKMGQGRGGYSAMRSSLKNVGLYGNLPLTGRESASAGAGKNDRGGSADPNGRVDANNNPDGAAAAGASQANGESDAAVPPEYKQRVGDYFRRVADELEP